MIKVELKESVRENIKPFPKLMKCTGNIWAKGAIVLFLNNNTGIRLTQAIDGDKSYPGPGFGGYSDAWDISYFTDYNEPITLQNA